MWSSEKFGQLVSVPTQNSPGKNSIAFYGGKEINCGGSISFNTPGGGSRLVIASPAVEAVSCPVANGDDNKEGMKINALAGKTFQKK